jgi:hypothetical protein
MDDDGIENRGYSERRYSRDDSKRGAVQERMFKRGCSREDVQERMFKRGYVERRAKKQRL